MASIVSNIVSGIESIFSGNGVNLILGDVVFENFEIPDSIHTPGDQLLVVHKLIGGARQIDAMGSDPQPISWSGRFRGESAESRAQHLSLLRAQGQPLSLTWNSYRFLVVIKTFTPDYQQPFEIPYSISCEVVADESLPILASIPGLSLAIVNDISTGLTIASSLGITSITNGLNSLQAAFNTSTLAGATPATGQQLQTSIGTVQAPVNAAITSNNAVLAPGASGSGLAGISSGVSATAAASALLTSANAATSLGRLLPLASTLGRMSINAGSLGQ